MSLTRAVGQAVGSQAVCQRSVMMRRPITGRRVGPCLPARRPAVAGLYIACRAATSLIPSGSLFAPWRLGRGPARPLSPRSPLPSRPDPRPPKPHSSHTTHLDAGGALLHSLRSLAIASLRSIRELLSHPSAPWPCCSSIVTQSHPTAPQPCCSCTITQPPSPCRELSAQVRDEATALKPPSTSRPQG